MLPGDASVFRMCVAMLRGVAGRGHALFLEALVINEL